MGNGSDPRRASSASPSHRSRPARQTHYERLDIGTDASIRDVRRAYLKLIKRHHPDLNREDSPGDAAQAVNQAYHVLGDPARRRAYDVELQNAYPIVFRSILTIPPLPGRRFRWAPAVTAIVLTTIAIFCLGYARTGPDERMQRAAIPWTDTPYRETAGARRTAIVQQAGLNLEWIALQSDATAAERYSRRCWDSLLGSGSDGLFDYCLAFDAAAEHAFNPGGAYFTPTALRNRAGAMSGGRLATGEALPRRIAWVHAALAVDRRAGSGAAPLVNWFPLGRTARTSRAFDVAIPPAR